jgi:hypothetical protein
MTTTLLRPAPSRLPQRSRRAIVLAAAAASAAALLTVALLPPDSLGVSIAKLVAASGSVLGFGYAMTRSMTWYLGNAPDTALDERERAIRDRAYFKAYGTFAGLAIATAFYLLDLGPDLGLPVPAHYDAWWAIVWAFVMLGLGLPAGFVAWDLPDPVFDTDP